MGNSPATGGLRPGDPDDSCIANIGRSVVIEFSGRKVDQGNDGKITESWTMVYNTAGKRQCTFYLFKTSTNTSSPTPLVEKLQILMEDTLGQSIIQIRQGVAPGLLHCKCIGIRKSTCKIFSNDTTNAYGDITHTDFETFERGKAKVLMVSEYKRRRNDEIPHTVTVAHYYINTEDGVNVGVSVAVRKIKVLWNGSIDFAVDGPEKHPTNALLYMFDEVCRTKTWKYTYCHHCADKIIQRQRASIGQSETKDSDIDNVPAVGVGSRPNGRGGLVSNDGWFRGNKNGNLNVRNLFLGARAR